MARTASAPFSPARANSVMMFDVLGLPAYDPLRAVARKSVEKLLVVHAHEAYCQPCVSPVWDTGLVCQTLLEVGGETVAAKARRGLDWLAARQGLDGAGGRAARPPPSAP